MIYVLEVQDNATQRWEYREQSTSHDLLCKRLQRKYTQLGARVRPVTDVVELARIKHVPRYNPVTGMPDCKTQN